MRRLCRCAEISAGVTSWEGTLKRILIEWFRCDGEDEGCSICAESSEVIKGTMERMRPFLRTMQVQLDLKEARLPGNPQRLSNALKINGKESAGAVHESLNGEMLVDAILKEASRFARSGCGCSLEDLFR